MPQIKVKHGVHVNKPPAEVFAFLSDPDKMPQWQSSNFEVKELLGTGVAVGAVCSNTVGSRSRFYRLVNHYTQPTA